MYAASFLVDTVPSASTRSGDPGTERDGVLVLHHDAGYTLYPVLDLHITKSSRA